VLVVLAIVFLVAGAILLQTMGPPALGLLVLVAVLIWFLS
jgi:hypothetical protein